MTTMSVADQLFYTTAKVTAHKNGTEIGSGTGFFMSFCQSDQSYVPVLVTNKHVIAGADNITLLLHLARDGTPSTDAAHCTIVLSGDGVFYHPDPEVDVCVILIGELLQQAFDNGTPIFFRWLTMSEIPPLDEWDNFDSIEDVLMVGCPNGIFDEHNHTPIIRRGITATPITKKYNGREEFMVDIACFPGSSGSPIVIYDRLGYQDRATNTYMMGQQRLKLVGILYAGPQYTASGQIVLNQDPQITVDGMMHLGYVIRSSALQPIEIAVRNHLKI